MKLCVVCLRQRNARLIPSVLTGEGFAAALLAEACTHVIALNMPKDTFVKAAGHAYDAILQKLEVLAAMQNCHTDGSLKS